MSALSTHATAAATAGWRIDGLDLPVPCEFAFGDPALVEAATGLDWDAFTERLAAPDRAGDMTVVYAMFVIAVKRAHPRWSVRRVVAYTHRVEPSQLVPA